MNHKNKSTLRFLSLSYMFVYKQNKKKNTEWYLDRLLKVQSRKLKKHWQMIAYVFQKHPENFALQLFIILQHFTSDI